MRWECWKMLYTCSKDRTQDRALGYTTWEGIRRWCKPDARTEIILWETTKVQGDSDGYFYQRIYLGVANISAKRYVDWCIVNRLHNWRISFREPKKETPERMEDQLIARGGYSLLKPLLLNYNIVHCDDLINVSTQCMYDNTVLSQSSHIDHFFVTPYIRVCSSQVLIIDSGANTSDHSPVVLRLSAPAGR